MVMNKVIKDVVGGSLLSIQEISEKTDIPVNRIHDVMECKYAVTAVEAFLICDAVGVDLDNLLRCY